MYVYIRHTCMHDTLESRRDIKIVGNINIKFKDYI